MNATSIAAPGLPLVLQLGFAGSRALLDPAAHPTVDAAGFETAPQPWLTERLRRLPAELGLTDRHFPCGRSALAIGGDTLFTRACQKLDRPQRLLLPQHREVFLHALSSGGWLGAFAATALKFARRRAGGAAECAGACQR